MTAAILLLALTAVGGAGLTRPREDEAALRELVKVHPENPLHQKALAQAAARQGALAEAIEHYQRALELAPRDLDARLNLGELFVWTRQFERAIVLYQDVLALDGGNLRAKMGLALAFRRSHRCVDAERLYQDVLAVEPENAEAWKGLAQTYALAGDFPNALACLDRGIALFPADAEIYVEKATVLGWEGHLQEAAGVAKKAIVLAPSSPAAYRTLGDIQTWRKEYGPAAESYRRALDLDPASVETALDLAAAYQAGGRRDRAEEAAMEALRRAPDDRKALEFLQRVRQGRDPGDPAPAAFSTLARVSHVGTLVLAGALLVLSFKLHRRRRLIVHRPRLYGLLYRVLLPVLALLLVATFALREAGGSPVLREAVEPLIFVTLGFSVFSLFWERRPVPVVTRDAVLVVGAHPDDLELGAGGFILRLKEEGTQVYALILSQGEKGTDSGPDRRAAEAEAAGRVLGFDGLWVLDFPDTLLRDHIPAIKTAIEEKVKALGIGLVITHSFRETHGDHVAVFEAAKEAARRASLLCFETVSTPQEFVPNFFVDVTPYLARKLQAIGVHRSQGEKLYMDPEMVRGRAAHRGLQVGLPYAEAFWVYRWLR